MRRLAWSLLFLAAVFSQNRGWAQMDEPIVREIEIRFVGPETVHRAVVAANIQTRVGEPRSRELIEQDVRALIATGYFFDVRVLEDPVADGVKITYQVQGKASIKEFVFEGQKRYREERLRRELTPKVGDILDERQIHLDKLKMLELYQKGGHPDVKIDHEISIDKDTGKAVVKFKVDEGARVFIKRIHIDGNKAYPDKRLLKLLKTRHLWWGSWFAGTGVLRSDQFQEDVEKLREHYRSHGYMDMEIRDVRVDRLSPKYIVIHIDVFEGQQYKVGDIRVEGNTLFTTEEIDRILRMKSGHTFTPSALTDDLRMIETFYGARGYLDTMARSSRIANVETGRIDLLYTIREGELTYIEKIEIRGNTKTKDKVIRRELAVNPGDVYNTVRVDRSEERLRNLGYFSKVQTAPEPTEVANRKDLAITVEEQRTGSVTFGGGFSSIDNFIGFVEVTQGNFDLFNWPNFTGGGQKLRLRSQIGLKRQDYVLSFTEPWFLDQRLALGVDLYHRSAGFLSVRFDETRTGGAIRLERALREFTRAEIQYSFQRIDLDVDPFASAELASQEGERLRSAFVLGMVYDTRDSVFLTTRGNRTEFSAELVGGPIGGDVSVYKLNAKTTFYFPFFNKHVLQVLGAAGVVEAFGASKGDGPIVEEISNSTTNLVKVNDVPIFDRYFLGGANTLRGFSFRRVGPKDINNEAVGGNTYANATIEYTFPIVEKVRGAVFFDIGNVWRDSYEFDLGDVKSNVGAGLRLNLPVGPLRLDYGYPIQTDSSTGKSGKLQFSVGYQF